MTITKPPPQQPALPMMHNVSSGSSINTGNTIPLARASSAVASASTTGPSKTSPSLAVAPPKPSPATSASATLPTTFSPGGGTNPALLTSASALNAAAKGALPASAAIHHHRGHHNNSAQAQAQVAVSASADPSNGAATLAAAPPKPIPHVSITVMQRWSLEQLDAHVKKLTDAGQSVPQAVSLLIADTRRREEKRHAKRLANRRSACTSRARKKALIEEMTRDNARLRRQALILSYLPDPVVAISTDGCITFCSMQVERVLRHRVSGLIGANIEDIMVPGSRESIRRLIRDLVVAEQRALSSSSLDEEDQDGGRGANNNEGNDAASRESRENNSAGGESLAAHGAGPLMPHEVSEHSSEGSFPPLLEVKVKAGQTSTEVAAGEDVSDSSGDRLPRGGGGDKNGGKQQKANGNNKSSDGTTPTEMSSLTHKNSSSFGPESGEDPAPPAKKAKTAGGGNDGGKKPAATGGSAEGSDESTSSENKASANLTKNVEMCKLNKDKAEGDERVRFPHKDDVMGAYVTANNADAKLSSLMHHPRKEGAASPEGKGVGQEEQQGAATTNTASIRRKHVMGPKRADGKQEEQSSSSADSSLSKTSKSKQKRSGNNSSSDSGYRESGESPEDSNEYPEDSSSSSGASSDRSSSKKKRRRTRPLAPACNVRLIRNDLSTIWCELTSSIRTRPPDDVDKELNIVAPSQGGNQKAVGADERSAASSESAGREEKELLLCFRPLREGESVGEEFRFRPGAGERSEKAAASAERGSDGRASSEERKVSSNNSSSEERRRSSNNSTSSKDGGGAAKRAAKRSASSTTAETTAADAPSSAETQVPAKKNRPPKKRKFDCEHRGHSNGDDTQVEELDERSAVESMMELARK